MDRGIVNPGQLPLDTDFLFPQQAAMIGLGYALETILGQQTVVSGLGVSPTTVPSMSVTVARGSITALTNLESTAYGSIAADTTDQLMKMGINPSPQNIGPFAAPTTAGQSVNILVQASFVEADSVPVVIPYYNATNPAVPFSGPNNTGAAQNTRRRQTVNISTIVGTAATTGTQTTPTPTATPLAVITIAYGATSITSGNIIVHPLCPIRPGVANLSPTAGYRYNLDGTIEQWVATTLTTAGSGNTLFSVALPLAYPHAQVLCHSSWGGNAPPSPGSNASVILDNQHVQVGLNVSGAGSFAVTIRSLGN